MAKFNVPGIKASTGMKGFPVLENGTYHFKVRKCEVLPPKNPAPIDVWTFHMDILEGPPGADGKPSKGQKTVYRVRVLQEQHPDFETNTMGVDELKSMIVAGGVTFKGEDVDPDKFVDVELVGTMVQSKSKTGDGVFVNCREWKAV